MKKRLLITSSLAVLLGLGVAGGLSLAKKNVQSVDAAVTNGKYRINVFVDSDNWSTDNIKTIFNAYSNGNQQMGKDADLAAHATLSNYNSVKDANGTTHKFQTVEFSARTALTKNDTTYVARSSASSDWWDGFGTSFNLYTQFRSNYWDNTFKITGTWNNFTATLMGWYNKVCLHTGTNLGTTDYILLKSDASPSVSDQKVPSGYTFVGWYTDSNLSTAWTSGSQYTDINLYAKYELIPVSYDVKKYEVLDGVVGSQIGETESVAGGTTYAVPDSIYKSGYTFGGWYTNTACTTAYTASAVNANLNLYAKYTTGGSSSGSITIDLRDSGWAGASANYAVYLMDKDTYPSDVGEWSTYVTGTAANECFVTVPYSVGLTPTDLLVYRYNPSYTQVQWEANPFVSDSNKWGQTKDVSFHEHVVIGAFDSTENKNNIYTGYARVLGGTGWTQIALLDTIKSNGSHHVEYYSSSVTLTANEEFKIVFGNNEWFGYDIVSTHSSIEDNFTEGESDKNIKTVVAGSYAFYFDSHENTLYITTVDLAAADEWAEYFLDNVGCDATGVNLPTGWNACATEYAKLSGGAKNIVYGATAKEDGNYVEQAVARYDAALRSHPSLSHFIVNSSSVARSVYVSPISSLVINNNSQTIVIVVIASVLAVAGVGGYFFFRRKKQQ